MTRRLHDTIYTQGVYAMVLHQGALTEKDREAFETAVKALQEYLRDREAVAIPFGVLPK